MVVCTKRTNDKEKHYLKITARVITYIIPLHNRLGLTTHGLIEISDPRETFMLFCEFPKTTTISLPRKGKGLSKTIVLTFWVPVTLTFDLCS